jgi:heterodisulfide reductase subunit C2
MHVTEAPKTIRQLAREMSRACYQCGKCSAGCPVAERMAVVPSRLVRLVQIDRLDKAAAALSAWECVSCQTCTTRCPQGVDCAGIMDALREMSIAEGTGAVIHNRTVIFQRVFLDNIRRNGRLNEMDLVGRFKTRSFLSDLSVPMLFKDALLGPKMLKRGKLHLRSQKVRDQKLVARIFEKCGL